MKKINIGTVFSGIGSAETAARRVFGKDNVNFVFACDNGERELKESREEIRDKTRGLDYRKSESIISKLYEKESGKNYIKTSYFANYSLPSSSWFEDIRFFPAGEFRGKLDILIGGSPCQSFSLLGKRRGFKDNRGLLFYDFLNVIKEIKPNCFVFENVPGMLTNDGGKTIKTVQKEFENLGYKIYKNILDSENFGIPQRRKRLIVIGFKTICNFSFPKGTKISPENTAQNYYEKTIPAKYYLGEKGFLFVTRNRSRAGVNRTIIRTERANQQFNWNGDFVFEPYNPKRHAKALANGAYMGEYNGVEGLARKLTPRECMNLMGFKKEEYKIVVRDAIAYRQAGNSIVVDVLEALLKNIKDALIND